MRENIIMLAAQSTWATMLIFYLLLSTKSPLNFLQTLLSHHVAFLQTLLSRHMALSNLTVDF